MEHLTNDLWDYIEEEVTPMMRRLKLYEDDYEAANFPNLRSDNIESLDIFAEEVLKCISHAKLNKLEVRCNTRHKREKMVIAYNALVIHYRIVIKLRMYSYAC